jgi:serine/threonine-protein kinase HipA
MADENRPTLGLRFKDNLGELITEFRPYQTRVMPFFSNLLPEEQLRRYLAKRAGVSPQREFFLLWVLGADLPGAIVVRTADGEDWPPEAAHDLHGNVQAGRRKAFRFSLAGVQLKFSAVAEASGGLTIPVNGVGGSWIVKLPSEKYAGIPENEYSMMTLARLVGIDVPATKLVEAAEIENLPEEVGASGQTALAIERFDRLSDGVSVHTEDFAQVFDLFPDDKYDKASYVNIASVIAKESGDDDVREFIRRLTFNTLIGNADMHLKNWSLMYPNRRDARLSPAYDFVSTIPYIPDEEAALKFSRTNRFDQFTADELTHLAARARLPKSLVLETAKQTVALFHEAWQREKENLPLPGNVIDAIDRHLQTVPLA